MSLYKYIMQIGKVNPKNKLPNNFLTNNLFLSIYQIINQLLFDVTCYSFSISRALPILNNYKFILFLFEI